MQLCNAGLTPNTRFAGLTPNTNACKENIDRGGKLQAVLLWALGANEDAVFAAFHARALLGRYRLVLPDRVEPMYALTLCVTREEAKAFLNGTGSPLQLTADNENKLSAK